MLNNMWSCLQEQHHHSVLLFFPFHTHLLQQPFIFHAGRLEDYRDYMYVYTDPDIPLLIRIWTYTGFFFSIKFEKNSNVLVLYFQQIRQYTYIEVGISNQNYFNWIEDILALANN